MGRGFGTGFMVSKSLFMTNNHVLYNKTSARNARIEFNFQLDYNGNPQQTDVYSLDPDAVFHTDPALDYTLVKVKPKNRFVLSGIQKIASSEYNSVYEGCDCELDSETSVTANPFAARLAGNAVDVSRLYWKIYAGIKWGFLKLPRAVQYAKNQHLNIIQHPRARRKEVAVQHNQVQEIHQNAIRYTTDTEPGSSGSPVFNNAWDLVALHHAAGTKQNNIWKNNEGMRLDKIASDLRNHFNSTPTGNTLIAELGI